jgi:hypothetical protein
MKLNTHFYLMPGSRMLKLYLYASSTSSCCVLIDRSNFIFVITKPPVMLPVIRSCLHPAVKPHLNHFQRTCYRTHLAHIAHDLACTSTAYVFGPCSMPITFFMHLVIFKTRQQNNDTSFCVSFQLGTELLSTLLLDTTVEFL